MTFDEWAAVVTEAFRGAGFEVTTHEGFPLVKRPAAMDEGVRLLKFQPTTVSVDKSIYAEGMLLLPAGSLAVHYHAKETARSEAQRRDSLPAAAG